MTRPGNSERRLLRCYGPAGTNAGVSVPLHPIRWRVLAAVAVLPAVLAIAGCGSSSKHNSSSSNDTSARAAAGIRYSDCMRAHGVTDFPDPGGSGGVSLSGAGINPRSPAFQTAQTACAKLMPGGGPAAQNADTAATKRQFLAAADCMRAHGISGFPDPTTGVTLGEPHGPGTTVTQNGVSFVVPASIGIQSPAFEHAMSVCHLPGFGPGGSSGSNSS
jgi:hypothetical protein